ncbi:hypothetical protein [Peribacillus loiseleuriae]|uniref:hypothetical protein n=1 Tax=Peribacillus loiseleuriae TaxID=1679170 RepID=UPI003D075E76
MEKELLERLWPIATSVVEEVYPNMKRLRPSHFEGAVAILVREFNYYDPSAIGSNEHVRDMMKMDLSELKESLA